jgi:hypothetical protein
MERETPLMKAVRLTDVVLSSPSSAPILGWAAGCIG